MQVTLLQTLLWSLTIQQSLAAIPFRKIGCDGWTYQGKTIEEMWDNAIAMTAQAQAQIDVIPTKAQFSSYSDAQKFAGANAKFLFGVNFINRIGLSSGGQSVMNQAKTTYAEVQQILLGTKSDLDYKEAFLFCGANGLVNTPIPVGGINHESPVKIWHAEIGEGDDKEYLKLSFLTAGYMWEPCQEDVKNYRYIGKTFHATHLVKGEPREFTGIILCPNQWDSVLGATTFATLDRGFTAVKRADNKYPYIGHYNSMSGTIVHEMVHVIGRLRNQPDGKYEDGAGGWKECVPYAKKDSSAALINPDTYRLFAEMNMSPATKWGPYNAPVTTTTTPAADANASQ